MTFEREVVLNIRHRLEMYEQQRSFDENANEDDIPSVTEFKYSHVHLGSRQCGLKLRMYEEDLEEALHFSGFGDSLAKFFREYAGVDVYGSDFNGDGFEGHQHCVFHCKVSSFVFIY